MSETAIENSTTTETKAKSTKAKTAKKGTKTKAAAPKAKPAKGAKPMRQRAPKEADLMTFAFRMPKAESAALHKAAGPANASRTMRSLAAAFVAEDRAAFETVVEDARKLR